MRSKEVGKMLMGGRGEARVGVRGREDINCEDRRRGMLDKEVRRLARRMWAKKGVGRYLRDGEERQVRGKEGARTRRDTQHNQRGENLR